MQEYEEKFDKLHSFKPKLSKIPQNFEYSVEKLYDDKDKADKIEEKAGTREKSAKRMLFPARNPEKAEIPSYF